MQPNPYVPADAVPDIDAALAPLRNDICTIQRPVSGTDATGAPIGGFATVEVTGCKVLAPGRVPIEQVGGGRLAAVVDYEVVFDRTVEVRSEDRILVRNYTLMVVADQDAVSHGFELRVATKSVES